MNQGCNPLSENRFKSLLDDHSALTSSHCVVLKCAKLSILPDQYEMELRELFKGANTYHWTSAYYTNGFLAFSIQLKNGAIAHIQSNLMESLLAIMLIPPQPGLAKNAGIEAFIDDETLSHWDLSNSRPPSTQKRHTSYVGDYIKTTTINLSNHVLLAYFAKMPSIHLADIGEFEVYKEVARDVYDSTAKSPVDLFLRSSVKEYLEWDREDSEFQSEIGNLEDSNSRIDFLAGWVSASRITPLEFEKKTGISFDTYQIARQLIANLEPSI